jgi:hypothetical protein
VLSYAEIPPRVAIQSSSTIPSLAET